MAEVQAFPGDFIGIKKGDVIVNVDGVGGYARGKEYIAEEDAFLDGNVAFVRVHNGVMVHTRFVRRFGWPVGKEAPKERKAICIDNKGTKLVKGYVYDVVKENDNSIRVKGHAVWFKKSRFFLDGVAFVPPPKVDEDDKNLKELADKVGDAPGTCSYATLFNDGKINWQVKDACHARLFNGYPPNNSGIKAIYLNVSGHYKRHANKEEYKRYVQYITQESPWAGAFVPRPIDKVMEDGICMDVTKTSNYLISAAVALRVGSEFPLTVVEFNTLVEAGCGVNAAFITAVFAYYCRTGNENIRYFNGSHHVISSSQSITNLIAFFNEGKVNDPGVVVKGATLHRYNILNSIAKEQGEEDSVANWLEKNHKGIIKTKNGWGGSSLSLKKHPVYGWSPLAFTFSKVFK